MSVCLSFGLFGLIFGTAEPIFMGFSLEDRGGYGAIYTLLFIPEFPLNRELFRFFI